MTTTFYYEDDTGPNPGFYFASLLIAIIGLLFFAFTVYYVAFFPIPEEVVTRTGVVFQLREGLSVEPIVVILEVEKEKYPLLEGPGDEADIQKEASVDDFYLVKNKIDDWLFIESMRDGKSGWIRKEKTRTIHGD